MDVGPQPVRRQRRLLRRVVLAVLAGELTLAAAARQAQASEQSVGNWKRQFLETDRAVWRQVLLAGRRAATVRQGGGDHGR